MTLDITTALSSLPEAVKILAVFAAAALGLIAVRLIGKLKKSSGGESGSGEAPAAQASVSEAPTSLPNPAPLHPEDAQKLLRQLQALGNTLTLIDTDEKTAAVIMAITSHRLNIPLSRLHFSSVRLLYEPLVLEGVSEPEAAIIMALTSYRSGIPLENLMFNSIKLVD